MILLLCTLLFAQAAGQQTAAPLEGPRVEVVLFSDFQCPFCAQFALPFRELQTKGIDGIETRVEFKNFPLSFHANAQLAHQAAVAAKAQGKFWEMHDLLFANQQRVQRADLLAYARKLGLDLARFQKDLDSERTKQVIVADLAEGNKLGVNGTPTYTINGKVYSGARSFAQLAQLIGGEQRRARALAEITDASMSRGPSAAPVTLEMVLDLESPVSRPAIDVVNRLMQRYPETVRLQFRNFPLSFHPQAALAHEAAMAGARHGHFWDFATFILDRQGALREQDLIAYAATVGLDAIEFAATIHDHRYASRVDADVAAGTSRGVRGSPVLLVNGRRIDGVPSLEKLIELVDAELVTKPERSSRK